MGIVARMGGMLTRPREEWAVVAGEPADTRALFERYALPVAALPAVVNLLVALGVLGLVRGLVIAVVSYVLGLAGLWLAGKVVEMLAPRFGGIADETQAMKLVVYSYTAAWIAGIAAIVPFLGAIIALLGAFYSLYTFYLGAPVVVRVPEARALTFTLAVVAVVIVISLVIGAIVAAVAM